MLVTLWGFPAAESADEHAVSVGPAVDRGARLHLDIRMSDVDASERAVPALGATRVLGSPETGYRVLLDLVGHPFCLVHGGGGGG